MRSCALVGLVVLVLLGGAPAFGADEQQMALAVLNSMQRIGQDDPPSGTAQADIHAARNEVESFQVVIAAVRGHLTVTSASMSDLVGKDGTQIGQEHVRLYREEYVRVRRSTNKAELPPGLYVDPLVPFINPLTGEPIEPRARSQARWGEPSVVIGHDMYALPCDVFEGQNQPIWVDIHVPKDAKAGVYEGEFTVRTKRRVTATVPVTLTVWDFTLPDGPTHSNHFGHFRNVARDFDVARGSEEYRDIEARYCKAMAEHRINPPIPSHLLPTVNGDGSLGITPEQHQALAAFLQEHHVTDFEIPRCPFARLPSSTSRPDYKDIAPAEREKAQRYYRQYYDYLKKNGWQERAYVYMWDEPNLKENYEQVLVLGKLVHQAVPELKCLVVEQTYLQDPSWPDMDPAIDIWCPLWSFIDRKTIRQKLEQGDQVWSYTALVQNSPRYHPEYDRVKSYDPPYWHIDRPLIVYRLPTWINRQYGITGLLYWSTVTTVIAPWWNPAFAHPRHYNGGGYLFYPGVPCGIDGPITSIRLKNLRDGMEDYEYLAILEGLGGSQAVKEHVDKIAPNWWDANRDPDQLLAVRKEIAQAIVSAKGKAK